MYSKLLIAAGLRSSCCGAKIATWHASKYYCTKCDGWLGRGGQTLASSAKAVSKTKAPRLLGLRGLRHSIR